jgi:tetrapyrrole methylase family protein/MazG family protein
MFQMTTSSQRLRSFAGLRRIVATLRGPGGCPWDRVQTHETLRPYLIEDCSEVLEAITAGNPAALCEELGDLLLQVLLHVQMAEENGDFALADVVHSIASKLVRRHPHVFGDAVAETPADVISQWDELKAEERGEKPTLAGIPATLPALAYAQAQQRRAHRAGFAFEAEEQVWEALDEEITELRRAGTAVERREELGDALFALAGLGRWYGVDAEDALGLSSRRFAATFERMEANVEQRNLSLQTATLAEKLTLWDEARAQEKKAP